MELFRIKKDIPFMQYASIFNIISIILFLLAIFFLFSKGLHFSIEFTGGTVIEATYPKVINLDTFRKSLKDFGLHDIYVQNFGTAKDIMIRFPVQRNINSTQSNNLLVTALKLQDNNVKLQRIEFIGPQVGRELIQDSIIALIMLIIGIIIYLTIRFEWKFAIAAIIANLHDIIIIMGFFAVFQWEFSLIVFAAILAVLGYSVNESVVIFDRIRELFRRKDYNKISILKIINHAITSTISRTIITHISTELMVLSMLFFGGQSLYYFSIALTIGILFSIYSSVFVAATIIMWLKINHINLVEFNKEHDTTII